MVGTLCWHDECFLYWRERKEDHMFAVHSEKIGDVAVIVCTGRMVGSDAAFKLRDEVRRQRDALVVLLDLSELQFLGGDALGMLVFLQAWARSIGIEFKLFDPPPALRQSLRGLRSAAELEMASIDDVLTLLHRDGPRTGTVDSSMTRVPGLHAA
jgi:anti-anti-sigma regulatory factor